MQLNAVLNYSRSKIHHIYDPSHLFSEQDGLRGECTTHHKGLYLGVVDSMGKQQFREGFMVPEASNVMDSADIVVKNLFEKMQSSGYTLPKFLSSQIYLTVIYKCDYIADPMSWDADKDGVVFQWGQRYRALYLPYEIKQMNLPKTSILDRLCCWGAGTASNLWMTDSGLVFKLTCDSIS